MAARKASTAACNASAASVIICLDTKLASASAEALAMASLNAASASLVTHVPSVETSEPSTETATPAASFLASATAEVSAERSTASVAFTDEKSIVRFSAGLPASGWMSALIGTAYSLLPVNVNVCVPVVSMSAGSSIVTRQMRVSYLP